MQEEQYPAPDDDLLFFERQAADAGYTRIAGVDEVGRGPLAGPVVAAAVVFPCTQAVPEGLNDSKQLQARQRERLYSQLHAVPGIKLAVGIVTPADIDRMNILQATHSAMRSALQQLLPCCDFALVDGLPVAGLPVASKALVKGDSRSASIAAASIIAKVYRDRVMQKMDAEYPGYGFATHKGYGTSAHLEALERLGPSPIHRKSFAPISRFFAEWQQPELPLFDQP